MGLIPARTQSQSIQKAAESRAHKLAGSSHRTSTSQKAKGSKSNAPVQQSVPTILLRRSERILRTALHVPSPGPSSAHPFQSMHVVNLRPAGGSSVSAVKSEYSRRGVNEQEPPDSESDSDDSTSDLERRLVIVDAESRQADADLRQAAAESRREEVRLKALRLRLELERKKRASRHGAGGEQSTQNKKRRVSARGGSVERIDLTQGE
ncbi:uncharacterized protein LAESUDRAFT_732508 [Laetiporus sulphureus 93-53]|uniref:Uncharacterized protein n=1 Tax=Laetiporus sulphureus 93-53 TaxID=1314785 RepID=A0A165B414_9APHY|nr:uncharacterized protein LAESUDRAFT_732508 [Laetiporus sulphureus 93-53]KZT00180.1 hypothetical protein LAESUDRAFT_732508 [Laetiporus sulphureus 93-53]